MLTRSPQYRAVLFREADRPALADALWRLRKTIFVDVCGWNLPVEGDREKDAFDRSETVHCALFHQDALIGTFRANRTDRPYLAADVFPHLATEEPFPRSARFWEISRFGVVDSRRSFLHARVNYAVMFGFAEAVEAQGLVAIADLTYERFLSTLGIVTRRYGPPRLIGTDRFGRDLIAVAGEIPMAGQTGARFQKLLDELHLVEIIHAAQLRGPARVPA